MVRQYTMPFLIDLLRRIEKMKVKYFPDTDTALIEFTDREVYETKEIGEDIYIDLDQNGNLVNMTIEHAKTKAGLREFSYQEMVPSLEEEAEQVAEADR